MKRLLILSTILLWGGFAQAQVTKQVEVTKAYVPEVSKAVKMPIVPDMTDTVQMRPEIDYSITPLAMSTNLNTEPFKPATVTYWEFNRPRPFYLKVGAGIPLNSVLDFYASTQNSGTGYVVGYINHQGEWAKLRNNFSVKPESWQMQNRIGATAGLYIGRHVLEGNLDVSNRVYHNYAFDGYTLNGIVPQSTFQQRVFPFTHITNDRQVYNNEQLRLRIGDDFTDLSRLNFNVGVHGNYFIDTSELLPSLNDNTLLGYTDERYHELSAGADVKLAKAFGRHALEFRTSYDGAWRNVRHYRSTQYTAGIQYRYLHEVISWSVGLDYVYDRRGADILLSDEEYTLRVDPTHRLLPQASICYNLHDDRCTLYAQLDGEVLRNDMHRLSLINPYVGSALNVPNSEVHRLRGGLRGRSAKSRFAYDLYVQFEQTKNALQWVATFCPATIDAGDYTRESYEGFYDVRTTTLKDLSVNAELTWRPSTHFVFDAEAHLHSFKGAAKEFVGTELYTLAYGRPQLTARLRGEYRTRKVSLELEALMQSTRHWSTYATLYALTDDTNLATQQTLIDEKVPTTVDLRARFNWFLRPRFALFAEGSNLCNAKLYDWAYYRNYGVGFTVGVKIQF
jgi:hypothetical protein